MKHVYMICLVMVVLRKKNNEYSWTHDVSWFGVYMPEMSACAGKSSHRCQATCHSNTNTMQTLRRYGNYSKVAEKAVLRLLHVAVGV